MPPKKTAAKKTNTKNTNKKTYNNKIQKTPKFDGESKILSTYFEVKLTQTAQQSPGVMAWALMADGAALKLKLDKTGTGTISANNGDGDNIADNALLNVPQFTARKAFYNMYKTNFVSVKVTTDRECGLDNPIIFMTDNKELVCETSVAKAYGQSHKEYILTESSRTRSYGWKATQAREKEYSLCDAPFSNTHKNNIRVLQDIEGKVSGVCTHRVVVTVGVTFSDTKSLNL